MTTKNDLLKEIDTLPAENTWSKLCSDKQGHPSWGRWQVQHDAVKFASVYLAKDYKHHEKAALIRMPTGTGKTGVMAIVVNYLLAKQSCLIIVPSTYLTDQVARALNKEYWEKINKRPKLPTPAVVFLPSTLGLLLKSQVSPTVFICTQKALADVYETKPDYNELKARISTVLVDEGHREPALTWAKAVRSLDRPTILFSATPYRNDLRMFRIGRGEDYRFPYFYHNALSKALVRQVIFQEAPESFVKTDRHTGHVKRDENAFARGLLRFYRETLLNKKPKSVLEPHVIVRCNSAENIERVQRALRTALAAESIPLCGPEKVIAIHDNFSHQQPHHRFTHPPKPHDEAFNAIFWIHQFKMVEGVDNPDLCCVAIFEPFGNSRSLVQQVGRIIRNPSGSDKECAYVFYDAHDGIKHEWEGFISFENTERDIIGAEDIVHAIREAQPKWYYANDKFRRGVDFDGDDCWGDARIPATTQIYTRPSGYTMDDLVNLATTVNEQMNKHDATEVRMLPKKHGAMRASVTTFFWEIQQSEYFNAQGFFDVRLLVAHLYMNEYHIFYQGIVTLDAGAPNSCPEKVAVDNLLSAIPTTAVTLKQMSLINSDMGDMAVRRRDLGGRSLEFSSAALSDHLHFVAACVCSGDGTRRYLGLSNSRITDSTAKKLSFDEFHDWADQLSAQMASPTKHADSILRRFAPSVRRPKKSKAMHLLLDLNEFREEFAINGVFSNGIDTDLFEATACDVDDDGKFECIILGELIAGTISYSSGRFTIKSDQLNNLCKQIDGKRIKASSYLSSPSTMRIVTEDGLIYADGRFYSPSKLHGSHRHNDLRLFVEVPELGTITKGEKGDKGNIGANTWQLGSIFQVIDKSPNVFTPGTMTPDILICDDMGTEMADFVALHSGNPGTIALLHAKPGSGSGSISVGDLHVVVSQAKKNLVVFDPTADLRKRIATKWNGNWTTESKHLPRIRKSIARCRDGKSIVSLFDEMRKNVRCRKEVWLVLGNMFGMSEIRTVVLSDDSIPFHWAQMLYLIHSLNASVTAVGAQLRILVGP